ncbi:MAG: UDP-N-acetylglucosamine 2-epimerase (non-hydrolyzing) [Rhodothermales bacterium]
MKVFNVVGARPNFMKIGPLHRAFEQNGAFESIIVHTGQHYDERMSDVFFTQLQLPEPDIYLGVGSGSHAAQTARIMIAFEGALIEHRPDLVLVVGDVNSTVACTLVAAKSGVPVAHVEAGLRSGDRTMPEEINRIVTDSISDYLFVTEQSGLDHLRREGIADEKVFMVGNVMIDSLVHFRETAAASPILQDLGLRRRHYALMTMHRPSNVDDEQQLALVVESIELLCAVLPVVMPMHPRTRSRLEAAGLMRRLDALSNLVLTEPLGYLEFLRLMDNASLVVTDSGGVQEETTFLQIPCLTLRENTERPVTIELGTNELLPLDPRVLRRRVDAILTGDVKQGRIPPLWDGNAATRIVDALEQVLRPVAT